MFDLGELQGTMRLAVDRGRDLTAWTLKVGDGSRLHGRQTPEQHRGKTPVVLLHGFCGKSAQMLGIARAVGAQQRALIYDARGHGESSEFVDEPTMRQLADDLAAVIDFAAADKVDIVGLSMGAQTVFEYLRHYGTKRIRRLVFVDQGPKLLAEAGWDHALFGGMEEAEVADFLKALRHRPRTLGRAWLRGLWRSREHVAIKIALTPQLLAGLPGTKATTLRLGADMLRHDWRPVVQKIDVPVLLCYGGHSMYPDAGRWMAANVPGSQLEWFANSGHGLMFQEPVRVARVVKGFLG